jgi:DNA-binding response OmpR family regulator
MMPDINGFDVCIKLKANKRTAVIPVIFVSALSNPQQIIKGFEAGGSDYVTKPFNKDEALARTRVHINMRQEKENYINTIAELQAKISFLERNA